MVIPFLRHTLSASMHISGSSPPSAGVIPVKVTGEFEEGDLLTSSDKKGYAKVNSYYIPGTIIGKVLQKLDDDKALMLIMNC